MPVASDDKFALQKKIAIILINIIAFCFIAVWARKVLMPLVFAMLFSFVLLPLAGFLERKLKFHRVLASALSVILLIAIGSCFVYLALTQFSGFADHLPEFRQKLLSVSSQLQNWISQSIHISPEKQKAYFNNTVSKVSSAATSMVGQTVYTLTSILLFIILTVFFNFFILMYRNRITTFLLVIFSKENNVIVNDIINNIQHMIKGYMVGILLEMAIVSTLCTIAFSVLGIPYAFLLGLMTGIFNVIPYVGIFSSMTISMLVTLVTSGAGAKALLVVAVIVPVHLIDSNIILPFLVGSRVRVNAFITFLAIVAGGLLWGIAGMFLSIPLTAIVKIIFDRVENLNHWGFLFGDDEKPAKKILRRSQKK
ncbi:MAG TPA: AI-2E family transporter [Puia sp.]|jgi:predicted PurR-regulated permease PerM|nr:AI-2E family transporter [Puia sp.]